MICGTPVVASDLPGVRQPVNTTGMGKIVPIRNSAALADAILEVIDQPQDFRRDPEVIIQRFSPAATAQSYEDLFQMLLSDRRS
jgi:glycosyltransferase involved in cell wall biosynthesis